jgi:hypothetical protein
MQQTPRALAVLNPVAGSSHDHVQQLLEDHFIRDDGEFIGRPPVTVELVRNAIQVVVPAEQEKGLDVKGLFGEAISELTHDERREAESDGPEG